MKKTAYSEISEEITDVKPKVFRTAKHLFMMNMDDGYRVFVNQGGTSSAKTFTLLQVILYHAIKEKGVVCTVVGQDIPNLKVGALRDMKNIIGASEWLAAYVRVNESTSTMTLANGSLIEFKSYADEQDAKSGKRDYLFVNEANGITYPIYWQLAIRTRKKIWIDYNPTARFWVHDEVIGREGVRLIISNHRDNPFLTEEEHERIENISDPELWKVYARGLTGKVQGLVLTNWDIVDALPDALEWKMSCRGLDFGFSCFRGDTLIMTKEGEKPIKEVKAGDFVLTRKGYRKVRRNIYNGYKETIHKKFVNGLQIMDIFCTFEHNFNANGKWKKYGELTAEDKLFMLSHSMAWSSGDTQTGSIAIITTTRGKKGEKNMSQCCIMPSLKRLTEQSRKACAYITRISTRLTTISKTLCLSPIQSICGYITSLANGLENIQMRWKKDTTPRRIGKSVGKKFSTTCHKKHVSANIAARSSRQQTRISDSAERSVTIGGSIRRQRTISRWFASIAERLLKVISISSQNVAAANVLISNHSVSSIQEVGKEWCDVYDLEIEDVHEYFANGILVHNCDPSALEHVVLAHGDLWVDEELYQTGMTNPMLARKAKEEGVTAQDEIIADCAEPKSIQEMRGEGLWVVPSLKGQDSIVVGLDILRRYRIHVTRRSKGLIDNLRSYSWSKDRDGNMTNKPEDRNNHGIDAVRYVALKKLNTQPRPKGVRRAN